jgi:protein tyrosine/serine phosphatase
MPKQRSNSEFMKKNILFYCFLLCVTLLSAQHKATLIHKDANFYKVDDLLYRSEQLVNEDKEVIKSTNIKTIINLRYFTRTGDKKIFTNKEDIHLINHPLLTWRIKAPEIAQTLKLIREQQKKGAVLVHCYHGADRTGIMVAMYRIIYHNWTIAEAKQEMLQGPYGYHSVWKNLEALFTEQTVNEVRQYLGIK